MPASGPRVPYLVDGPRESGDRIGQPVEGEQEKPRPADPWTAP